MKKFISYILSLLIVLQFAAVGASAEGGSAGEYIIPESDYLYVDGDNRIRTVEGEQTLLFRLFVGEPQRVHILTSGVNVTLVIYNEAADAVVGAFTSVDGLLDAPFDAAPGSYLLGLSGWGEVAILAASEAKTAQIYAQNTAPDTTDETAESADAAETVDEADSTDEAGNTDEAATEESTEEPAETPAGETTDAELAENELTPTEPSEEALPVDSSESESNISEPSPGGEGGSPTGLTDDERPQAPYMRATEHSEALSESEVTPAATDEVTPAAAEASSTEFATEESSPTDESVPSEPTEESSNPESPAPEEDKKEKGFLSGFVSWLTGSSSSQPQTDASQPDEQPVAATPADASADADEEATPADTAQPVDEAGSTDEPLNTNDTTESDTTEPSEEALPVDSSEETFSTELTDERPATEVNPNTADQPAETPAEEPTEAEPAESKPIPTEPSPGGEGVSPSGLTDEVTPVTGESTEQSEALGESEVTPAAADDISPVTDESTEQSEALSEMEVLPITASIPMNQTVSLLSILTDAGAPVNVITAMSGATEGRLVAVSQNGDWLLTPYAYYDSLTLTVTATDYLAADSAASAVTLTVILTNPNPAASTEEFNAVSVTEEAGIEDLTDEPAETPADAPREAELTESEITPTEPSPGGEGGSPTGLTDDELPQEPYMRATEQNEALSESEVTPAEADEVLPGAYVSVDRVGVNEICLRADTSVSENPDVFNYQWQYSLDGETWMDIPGATDSTFSFTLDETTSTYFWRLLTTEKDVTLNG